MSAIGKVCETSTTLAIEGRSGTTASEQPLSRHFLSKQELALVLGVSPRTLDSWISQRRIPFLRLSRRLIKYDLARVKAALNKYEVKEIGRCR